MMEDHGGELVGEGIIVHLGFAECLSARREMRYYIVGNSGKGGN